VCAPISRKRILANDMHVPIKVLSKYPWNERNQKSNSDYDFHKNGRITDPHFSAQTESRPQHFCGCKKKRLPRE
jgi:hypothetical protein